MCPGESKAFAVRHGVHCRGGKACNGVREAFTHTTWDEEEYNAIKYVHAPTARDITGCSPGDRAALARFWQYGVRRRCGAAGLRRQDPREVHAEFRRHRVD